jgi:hypothetical protein
MTTAVPVWRTMAPGVRCSFTHFPSASCSSTGNFRLPDLTQPAVNASQRCRSCAWWQARQLGPGADARVERGDHLPPERRQPHGQLRRPIAGAAVGAGDDSPPEVTGDRREAAGEPVEQLLLLVRDTAHLGREQVALHVGARRVGVAGPRRRATSGQRSARARPALPLGGGGPRPRAASRVPGACPSPGTPARAGAATSTSTCSWRSVPSGRWARPPRLSLQRLDGGRCSHGERRDERARLTTRGLT